MKASFTIFYILAFLIVSGTASADWTLETLDSEGCTGYWTSIQMDSMGLVHIVYRDDSDNHLVHVYQDGSSWQSEILNTSDCWFISMVLDSQDRPRVSYFDNSNNNICYVSWNGSGWSTQIVESVVSGGSPWPRSDIELDSLDNPHIVWYDCGETDLSYALKTGSNWTVITVDSTGNTGSYPSLCLDSLDRPHISYHNFTDQYLMYASWDGGAWQIQAVDTSAWASGYTSLALDELDRARISYYTVNPYKSIRYAEWNSSDWIMETVSDVQYLFPSSPQGLCLDSDGYPHISTYFADSGYYLRYLYKDATGWHSEVVDGPGVGCDNSICLDEQDVPHISYFNITDEDLLYAFRGLTGIGFSSGAVNEGLSLSMRTNPATGIPLVRLNLPSPARIVLSVYDTTGKLVDTPLVMDLVDGIHSVMLGDYLPGVYFCCAVAEEETAVARFVVLQ